MSDEHSFEIPEEIQSQIVALRSSIVVVPSGALPSGETLPSNGGSTMSSDSSSCGIMIFSCIIFSYIV